MALFTSLKRIIVVQVQFTVMIFLLIVNGRS